MYHSFWICLELHVLLLQHHLEPAAFITPCLLVIIITFPDILLNNSPTPISLNPGNLLRGINLHATKFVAVPNHDEITIFCDPSVFSPDGPKPPFVLIAAFLLVLHQCRHTIGCNFCIGRSIYHKTFGLLVVVLVFF